MKQQEFWAHSKYLKQITSLFALWPMQEFCIPTSLGFTDNIVTVVPSRTVAIKEYSRLLYTESTKYIFSPAKYSSLWKVPAVSELWILWCQWYFTTQNKQLIVVNK